LCGVFDIIVVAADVNALASELANVNTFAEVAPLVGELASQSDLRAKIFPLRFPSTLSSSLLPIFTRALLYDAGLPAMSTVFVDILAEDGRILDLGVPQELSIVAPHLISGEEVTSSPLAE
jgi:hypothetical protein